MCNIELQILLSISRIGVRDKVVMKHEDSKAWEDLAKHWAVLGHNQFQVVGAAPRLPIFVVRPHSVLLTACRF
jgi:hypothetical protein